MLRSLRKSLKTLPLIPSLVILLVVISLGIWAYSHYRTGSPSQVVTVGKPITLPNAQSEPVAKSPTNNSTSAGRNSGTATDSQGSTKPSTPSDQWISSASGNITVKQPVANSKLQDGANIIGSAKIAEIHYRLKDNKVGVIAQGILSVNSGNFSGTLHFQPQGTGGQLDIYSTDASGVEYNEIQINVSF